VFVSWLASRVSNKTDPTIEYESNPKTINCHKPVPELVERNIYRKQGFFSHVFIVKPVFPINFPYHAMGFPRLPRSWLKRRDVDQPRGPAEGPAAAGGWWIFWENDGHIFQKHGPW